MLFAAAMEQVLAESQAFNLMIENYLNTRGGAAKNYQEKWDNRSLKKNYCNYRDPICKITKKPFAES